MEHIPTVQKARSQVTSSLHGQIETNNYSLYRQCEVSSWPITCMFWDCRRRPKKPHRCRKNMHIPHEGHRPRNELNNCLLWSANQCTTNPFNLFWSSKVSWYFQHNNAKSIEHEYPNNTPLCVCIIQKLYSKILLYTINIISIAYSIFTDSQNMQL